MHNINWLDSNIKKTKSKNINCGNLYKIINDMAIVKLTGQHGTETIVDSFIIEEGFLDYATFYQTDTGYARSATKGLLHHLVLNKPDDGMIIHHKNNNKLDNRLSNLEMVSFSENQQPENRIASKLFILNKMSTIVDNIDYELDWTNKSIVKNTFNLTLDKYLSLKQKRGNLYIEFSNFVALLPSNDSSYVFIISKESFVFVKKHTWRKENYIATQINKKRIWLSHFLIQPKDNMFIDHVNRQIWDNRLINLREVSRIENRHNVSISPLNKSGTKGLILRGSNNVVEFTIDGKMISRNYITKEKAIETIQHLRKHYCSTDIDNDPNLIVNMDLINDFINNTQECKREKHNIGIKGISKRENGSYVISDIDIGTKRLSRIVSNKSLLIIIKILYHIVNNNKHNQTLYTKYNFNLKEQLQIVLDNNLDLLPKICKDLDDFIMNYNIDNLMKTERQRKILYEI